MQWRCVDFVSASEQLVTVGLIDPKASDQNNNFGNGLIPTAQDYEDLKAPEVMLVDGRYLSGSTINVTYRTSATLQRRLRHRGFFKITVYCRLLDAISPR